MKNGKISLLAITLMIFGAGLAAPALADKGGYMQNTEAKAEKKAKHEEKRHKKHAEKKAKKEEKKAEKKADGLFD